MDLHLPYYFIYVPYVSFLVLFICLSFLISPVNLISIFKEVASGFGLFSLLYFVTASIIHRHNNATNNYSGVPQLTCFAHAVGVSWAALQMLAGSSHRFWGWLSIGWSRLAFAQLHVLLSFSRLDWACSPGDGRGARNWMETHKASWSLGFELTHVTNLK